MTISEYLHFYQSYLSVPCPLTDDQLQAYPYYLILDDQEISVQNEVPNNQNLFIQNGPEINPHTPRVGGFRNGAVLEKSAVKESPLSIKPVDS